MGALKNIDSAMLDLSCKKGVASVASCVDVPNMLTLCYDPFPHTVHLMVGAGGVVYILPSEVDSLANYLDIFEIRQALDALEIKILEL